MIDDFTDSADYEDHGFGNEHHVGVEHDYDSNLLSISDESHINTFETDALSHSDDNIDTLLNGHNELSWDTVDSHYSNIYDNLSHQFGLEVHGDPLGEIVNFDPQDETNSCAVASTNMIFNSLGYDFGEDVLADSFERFGIYNPMNGTDPHAIDEAINKIAETNGLDCRATEINGFNIEQLKTSLDSDDKILIGLNSSKLYNDDNMTLEELNYMPVTGHAVQLTGISDDESVAYINDPGKPDGAAIEIPMNRFLDACEDFGFTGIRVVA